MAPTEISTLSLHDALPICVVNLGLEGVMLIGAVTGFVATVHTGSAALGVVAAALAGGLFNRSEEHTSELQSHSDIVCRPLLEKKKQWSGSSRRSSCCATRR